MDFPFHHEAHYTVFDNANTLKKQQTRAERVLWQQLRRRQLLGLKFRRQHPIANYILDFYCNDLKLAIEVDGGFIDQQKLFSTTKSAVHTWSRSIFM
jgi:very-short-patch-repair endonuclease